MRVGTGLLYTTPKNTQIGVQHEYVNYGQAPIFQVIQAGILSGRYPVNFAHVLSLTINLGV